MLVTSGQSTFQETCNTENCVPVAQCGVCWRNTVHCVSVQVCNMSDEMLQFIVALKK